MSLGTVTVYRSTTGGAPAYTNTAGALLGVLDYCLVTGQGWSKTVLATNKASYTQPSGTNGFVFQVDDTGASTQARVLAYETLASLNTGTNQMPSNWAMTNMSPAFTNTGGFYVDKPTGSYTTGAPWRMFTNGAIFYLYINYASSNGDTYTGLIFGDILSYRAGDGFATIIQGHQTAGTGFKAFGTTYIGNQSSNSTPGGAGFVGFTMRPVTQNGTSLQHGWYTDYIRTNQSSTVGEIAWGINGGPNFIENAIPIFPVWLTEPVSGQGQYTSYGTRGLVPGVWAFGTWGHPYPDGLQFSGTVGGVSRTFEVVGAQGTSSQLNSGNGQIAIEVSNTWGGF